MKYLILEKPIISIHDRIIKLPVIRQGSFVCDESNIMALCEYGEWISNAELVEGQGYRLSNYRPLFKLKTIIELEQEGVNLHVADEELLFIAGIRGHYDIVKYLIEDGVDSYILSDLFLPTMIYCNQEKIVKYLLDNGIEINSNYSLLFHKYLIQQNIKTILRGIILILLTSIGILTANYFHIL